MKNPLLHRVALMAALALASTALHAAERGFFLGLAYSGVSPDYAEQQLAYPTSVASINTDTPSFLTGNEVDVIGSQGLKGVVGYRAFDWLAIEADYLDLSADNAAVEFVCIDQPCPDKLRADTSSVSLSALAMWPVGKFDLFARLGVSRWKSTVETLNTDGSRFWSEEVSGADAKYGVGAQLHIQKVVARLEYERLRFGGDAADAWSAGIAWIF